MAAAIDVFFTLADVGAFARVLQQQRSGAGLREAFVECIHFQDEFSSKVLVAGVQLVEVEDKVVDEVPYPWLERPAALEHADEARLVHDPAALVRVHDQGHLRLTWRSIGPSAPSLTWSLGRHRV